ncbi:hypothetical protein CDIK_4151 [Cucumispora dikerogammari]|nr:hypothetical protein CDIK_4151 [Cucumispora dikerogammari]
MLIKLITLTPLIKTSNSTFDFSIESKNILTEFLTSELLNNHSSLINEEETKILFSKLESKKTNSLKINEVINEIKNISLNFIIKFNDFIPDYKINNMEFLYSMNLLVTLIEKYYLNMEDIFLALKTNNDLDNNKIVEHIILNPIFVFGEAVVYFLKPVFKDLPELKTVEEGTVVQLLFKEFMLEILSCLVNKFSKPSLDAIRGLSKIS